MDEDTAYIEYLSSLDVAGATLRGTQPVSNPESPEMNRTSVNGRVFAAVPSYNRPSSRPPRESNPRDAYWKDNACVYTTVNWNGKSIQLPVIAGLTESVHVKSTILTMTVNRLKNAENIPWNDRCDILTTRFKEHAPIVDISAKTALSALLDPTSSAFRFDNLELVDIM